jgi:hypothetical protein
MTYNVYTIEEVKHLSEAMEMNLMETLDFLISIRERVIQQYKTDIGSFMSSMIDSQRELDALLILKEENK